VPKQVKRLSQAERWLPGYAPSPGAASIRVLGPIAEALAGGGGGPRDLGPDSVTRNGHSVVLRVDYGRAPPAADRRPEHRLARPAVERARGRRVRRRRGQGLPPRQRRHRPALRARDGGARATVVSSGDNEDYAHPRPRILGASARYGRESRSAAGETTPPPLHSTELARSVGLAFAEHARTVAEPKLACRPDQLEADFDPSPTGSYRRLSWLPIATDLVLRPGQRAHRRPAHPARDDEGAFVGLRPAGLRRRRRPGLIGGGAPCVGPLVRARARA